MPIELNFVPFPMFGKRLCPRIRGLHRHQIYRIDPQKDYAPLSPIVNHTKRIIHLDWIIAHWDRMDQFFASFASGQDGPAPRCRCAPRRPSRSTSRRPALLHPFSPVEPCRTSIKL
jgi:Tn3 transposase DDE domain